MGRRQRERRARRHGRAVRARRGGRRGRSPSTDDGVHSYPVRAAPRRSARSCACSSSSTSPGRTASSTAGCCTRRGSRWGVRLAQGAPGRTPTSSSPCPTRPSRPPSATRRRSGLPYREGLIKSRYVGRTFIQPAQARPRGGGAPEVQPAARAAARQAGGGGGRLDRARHDHRADRRPCCAGPARPRSTSGSTRPQMRHPCYMGVDTGRRDELIAANHSTDEIRRGDRCRLARLSCRRTALLEAVGGRREARCTACFDGVYPTDVPLEIDKLAHRAPLSDGAHVPRGRASTSRRPTAPSSASHGRRGGNRRPGRARRRRRLRRALPLRPGDPPGPGARQQHRWRRHQAQGRPRPSERHRHDRRRPGQRLRQRHRGQRRRPALLPRLPRPRRPARRDGRGRSWAAWRRGCAAAGIPLIGGETAADAGPLSRRRLRPGRLRGRRRGPRAELIDGSRRERRRRVHRAAVVRPAHQWLQPGAPRPARDDLVAGRCPTATASIGDALLEPHRSYLDEIRVLRGPAAGPAGPIVALAHITGGGWEGNVPRTLPDGTRRRDRDRLVAGPTDLHASSSSAATSRTRRWCAPSTSGSA